MALAETAELAVRLTLDDKMSPAIRKAQGGLRTLGNTARTVGKGVAVGAGIVATAGIVALTGAIHAGIEALKADKVVAAQTAAVIKSTGSAAGVSAQQVEDLAQKLSILDGVQDDVVQGAENVILRFTSIGSDIFPQVTQAAIDMAAATGTDAAGAALKLSRAIDNPVKGLTALTRAGIIFSDQEKAQITDLVKHNKLREAQAIVLQRVKQKFDGVAQAQADADPGRRLAVSTERFQKALASGLLPVIEKVQTRLADWLIKPETIAAVTKIGDAIGSLFTDQNLDAVASGLETAAKAVGVAISAFNQLPPEIKALAIGAFAINKVTGGAVTGAAEVFGKLLGAGLQKIFAANVTVIGTNVTGPGGGVPGGGGAAVGGGAATGLAAFAIPAAVAAGGSQVGNSIVTSVTDWFSQILPEENGVRKSITDELSIFIDNALPTPAALQKKVEKIFNFLKPPGQSPVGETRDTDKLQRGQSPVGETRDRDKLNKGIESSLNKYTARLGKLQQALQRAKDHGDDRRTQNLRQRIEQTNQRVTDAKQALTSTTVQTRDAARHAGISTTGATNSASAAIVAAIYAARPDIRLFVTASTVEKSVTYQNRAGPGNGSAGGGTRRPGNGTGNGGGN